MQRLKIISESLTKSVRSIAGTHWTDELVLCCNQQHIRQTLIDVTTSVPSHTPYQHTPDTSHQSTSYQLSALARRLTVNHVSSQFNVKVQSQLSIRLHTLSPGQL